MIKHIVIEIDGVEQTNFWKGIRPTYLKDLGTQQG